MLSLQNATSEYIPSSYAMWRMQVIPGERVGKFGMNTLVYRFPLGRPLARSAGRIVEYVQPTGQLIMNWNCETYYTCIMTLGEFGVS